MRGVIRDADSPNSQTPRKWPARRMAARGRAKNVFPVGGEGPAWLKKVFPVGGEPGRLPKNVFPRGGEAPGEEENLFPGAQESPGSLKNLFRVEEEAPLPSKKLFPRNPESLLAAEKLYFQNGERVLARQVIGIQRVHPMVWLANPVCGRTTGNRERYRRRSSPVRANHQPGTGNPEPLPPHELG